jgi:pimeloyl-ACP methyl ester carboxylesterase
VGDGLGGIYPDFDLRIYPGLAKAAPAYGLTAEELEARLAELNPIERVGILAKARVPALLIHGDEDRIVPLKENSAEVAARYKSAGAEEAVRSSDPTPMRSGWTSTCGMRSCT